MGRRERAASMAQFGAQLAVAAHRPRSHRTPRVSTRMTPYSSRAAASDTLPSTTSRSTSSGSRSSGSPQPPPPVVTTRTTCPGEHRLAVDQAAEVARRALDVDRHAERLAGLAAVDAVAAEPHPVGGDDGAAIDQRAVVLLVAEPAAPLAGAAGIDAQRKLLDQQRKARLGELGRLVAESGTMWMASLPSA